MKSIHFVGIGGIGLSALARYLKKEGFLVSGSDIKETKTTQCLRNEGIQVDVPHAKENIKGQDFVIYSAVIKDNNVELQEARKKGIMTLSRKEALPYFKRKKIFFSMWGSW